MEAPEPKTDIFFSPVSPSDTGRFWLMGKVFRPEDVAKGRKTIVEEATRDLSPGIREPVISILESWKGEKSKEQLIKLLGNEEATRLLRKVKRS